MSRSAEEQLLLEQRIQAMKLKNEELKRRHLEVEADKQSASKQNALVKTTVPFDDDWVPGRHHDNPRQDRSHQHTDAAHSPSYDRNDGRSQRPDYRRNRSEEQREDGYNFSRQSDESNPNFRQGRRNDYQANRVRPDGDRYYGNNHRRSGDWSGAGHDGTNIRSREWGPRTERGQRVPASPGDGSKPFPSKVYKNSSMEPDRGKRTSYRLAEGDGPPPDPSYSFLGDSMRDSPESVEKRRGFSNRRGFQRGRGRGGQAWNNRGHNDSRNEGFEDRRDSQYQNHDDAWRRERDLIDQARINRQKTSDGNWSREWDNNKVLQDSDLSGNERPQRWKRGNPTHKSDQGFSQRGHYNNRYQRQNYAARNDSESNDDARGTLEQDRSPSRNKHTRRGRFSDQNRSRDNPRFSNGSSQPTSPSSAGDSKGLKDAAPIESSVTAVEQLHAPVIRDASGAQKRSVEGIGGNLRISLSNDGDSHEGKPVAQKHPRKIAKAKRSRVLSSTSTGTTETAGEDDGSWEDLSSDEDISVVTELRMNLQQETGLSKHVDVSSGPESLDPIPAPGKEDEFLWDDFHPAGFQDSATVDLDAEAAYKALLDEKAKQGDDSATPSQPLKVSFKLDTSCLEDSGDEAATAKIDPLLVTTQIVQAEVDCMSLTSLPTDTSLPEDISQLCKSKTLQDDKIEEEREASNNVGITSAAGIGVSAEELSGPVSILDVPSQASPILATSEEQASGELSPDGSSHVVNSGAKGEENSSKSESANVVDSKVKETESTVLCVQERGLPKEEHENGHVLAEKVEDTGSTMSSLQEPHSKIEHDKHEHVLKQEDEETEKLLPLQKDALSKENGEPLQKKDPPKEEHDKCEHVSEEKSEDKKLDNTLFEANNSTSNEKVLSLKIDEQMCDDNKIVCSAQDVKVEKDTLPDSQSCGTPAEENDCVKLSSSN